MNKLEKFMEQYVYPNEKVLDNQLNHMENRRTIPPIIEELKQ